jgi:hypothetical protein
MKSLDFGCWALTGCLAVAILAGCGAVPLSPSKGQDDMPPPIGAPGPMTQSSATAAHADRGASWMLPEAKNDDLIYADSSSGADTYVFSSPSGKLVGTIVGGAQVQGSLCADAHGHIFVTGLQNEGSGLGLIYEYAHGKTEPVRVLQEPGVIPDGCASDPTTGDLAVSAWNWASGVSGVNIYRKARGVPSYYEDDEIIDYAFCGYDDKGNLFINGQGSGSAMYFAELPKGSSSFTNLRFSKYVDFFDMGQIQWDGSHITVEDFSTHAIYRVRVSGSNANVAGITRLKKWDASQLGLSWIAGDTVLAPTGVQDSEIGLWKYPGRGEPTRTIGTPGSVFSVAFSPAQRR